MRLVRLIYYDMWAYYPPKESKTISPFPSSPRLLLNRVHPHWILITDY
jgi:hypothetical protein